MLRRNSRARIALKRRLAEVLGKARRQSTPPAPDEALIQVISREFAEELVRPMRPGQEATFTAEFVRRWYENRRQRFGATA